MWGGALARWPAGDRGGLRGDRPATGLVGGFAYDPPLVAGGCPSASAFHEFSGFVAEGLPASRETGRYKKERANLFVKVEKMQNLLPGMTLCAECLKG